MKCRTAPCETCPYRRDVPSGVWSADEYEKLLAYDNCTYGQPPGVFYCHISPNFVCTGWAQVHAAHPRRSYELLSLRLAESLSGDMLKKIPAPTVPLFESGAEAAAHGLRDIERPSREAIQAIRKVAARRARKARR